MVVREILGRRARLPIVWIAALMAFGAIQGNAEAVVVTYSQNASYDHLGNGVWQNDPNMGFYTRGVDPLISVGRSRHAPSGPGYYGNNRGMLAFYLTGIPAGATIDSVSLVMTIKSYSDVGTTPPEVELHEIAGSTTMLENEFTWNSIRTGTPWSTPGGDFLPAVLASATGTASPSLGDTLTFASSTGFVSAAQGALDGSSPMELILLSPTAEADRNVEHQYVFASDDYAVESYRPMLSVEYSTTVIPEPASIVTWTMLSLAGLFFTCRRRKRAA